MNKLKLKKVAKHYCASILTSIDAGISLNELNISEEEYACIIKEVHNIGYRIAREAKLTRILSSLPLIIKQELSISTNKPEGK